MTTDQHLAYHTPPLPLAARGVNLPPELKKQLKIKRDEAEKDVVSKRKRR